MPVPRSLFLCFVVTAGVACGMATGRLHPAPAPETPSAEVSDFPAMPAAPAAAEDPLWAAVATADAPGIRAILTELNSRENSAGQFLLRTAAILRWAAVDGAACLEWLAADDQRSAFRKPAIIAWTRADAAAAVAWAKSSPSRALLPEALMEIAANQPDRFLECAGEWVTDDTPAWTVFLATMAKSDPVAAAELCLNADPYTSFGGLLAVARQWAASDRTGLVEWYENRVATVKAGNRWALTDSVAEGLLDVDPAASAAFFSAHAQPGELGDQDSSSTAGNIARRLMEQDPAEAVRWIRENTRAGISRFFPWAGFRLGDSPVQWMALSDSLGPPGEERTTAFRECLSRWQPENRPTALANARQLPDSPERDILLTRIATSWMDDAPEEASAALLSLPAGPERERLITAAVSGVGDPFRSGEDSASKIALVDRAGVVPPPGLLSQLPTQDAVARLSAPGAWQPEHYAVAAARWGNEDPGAAAAWVQTLPDDATGAAAAGELVKAWAEMDEAEASVWTQQLLPGPVRNAAAGWLANALAASDPEAAVAWFSTVTDPAVQRQVLEKASPALRPALQAAGVPLPTGPDKEGPP